MTRTLHILFLASGQQAWTAPSDLTLVGASCGGQVDAAISVDQSDDPANIANYQGIYSELIALWIASGVSAVFQDSRVFRVPVLEGQTIYFSAASGVLLTLSYDDLS